MKALIYSSLVIAMSSCGSKDSGGGDSSLASTGSGSFVKVPAFGKTLNMSDALLEPNCSQFYFSYAMMKAGNDLKCAGVALKTSSSYTSNQETWTATFSDGNAAFTGYTNADPIMKINGTDYYCYESNEGYLYPPDGVSGYNLSIPQIFSKSRVTKISELKPDDIFLLSSDDVFCNYLY